MSIKKDFFGNTRKPVGLMGKMMVSGMNKGHASVSDWGMSFLPDINPSEIADLGCGGGRNVRELLKRYPNADLTAVDYSDVSVAKTAKLNIKDVETGRCAVIKGDVSKLNFSSDFFDLATAFETIYFWPGPVKSFKEVYRILKDGGVFLIVNESDGFSPSDKKWTSIIDGMRVYNEEELKSYLKEAGFKETKSFCDKERHRLCILAFK